MRCRRSISRAVRLAQRPADPRQRVAGAIQHFAALVDAARDLVDQVSGGGDAGSHIGDVRKRLAKPRQEPMQRARPHQGAADIQQIHGQQGAAAHRLFHQAAQIVHAAQMDVALFVQQRARLAGLGLPALRLTDVVGGQQGQHPFTAQREGSVSGQPLANLVEFQHAQRSRVHKNEYSTGPYEDEMIAPYFVQAVCRVVSCNQ